MVLACMALLILALGVMTTINLGRTIHQRIGLQNTADASAYSMAVVEARSFNFFAFTNRAQVVHYVSAMCIQSYISLISFLLACLAEIVGVFDTLGQICKKTCLKPACVALQVVPGLDVLLDIAATVSTILDNLLNALNKIFDAIDVFLGRVIIPALQVLNELMYAFDKLLAEAVFTTDLPFGYDEIVNKNDDQVSSGGLAKTVTGLLTANIYNDAFEKTAGGQPLGGVGSLPDNKFRTGDASPNPAKRVMTEVANASRYIGDNFITERINPLENLPFGDELTKAIPLKKFGQTKLLSVPVQDEQKNMIRVKAPDYSQFAQGNSLGADDLFWIGYNIPLIDKLSWGDDNVKGWNQNPNGADQGGQGAKSNAFKVSVWAERDGGVHWRLDPNTPITKKCLCLLGLGCSFCACSLDWYYANLGRYDQNNGDGNHPWQGITPFMNFNISGSGHQDVYFNQPSTFSMLDKSYDKMIKNSSGDSDTNRLKGSTLGDGKTALDVATPDGAAHVKTYNDVAMPTPFKSGSLNVVSRGMAYYHRPHNWEEQPNWFNPFWRAKLDPVILGTAQATNFPGGKQLYNLGGGALQTVLGKVLVH